MEVLAIERYIKILELEKQGFSNLIEKNKEKIKEISDVIVNKDKTKLEKIFKKIEDLKENSVFLEGFKSTANSLSKSKNQVKYFDRYRSEIANKLENYKLYQLNDNFILQNDEKHIKIIDSGDNIAGNDDCENIEEQIAIMIELAKSKGWKLEEIEINSKDENFIKEANKQLGKLFNENSDNSSKNKIKNR